MPYKRNIEDRDFYIELGIKIRLYRNLARMTMAELGEKIDVSVQQLQKYEQGITYIPLSKLSKVAEILGFEINPKTHPQFSNQEAELILAYRKKDYLKIMMMMFKDSDFD